MSSSLRGFLSENSCDLARDWKYTWTSSSDIQPFAMQSFFEHAISSQPSYLKCSEQENHEKNKINVNHVSMWIRSIKLIWKLPKISNQNYIILLPLGANCISLNFMHSGYNPHLTGLSSGKLAE